MQPQYGQGAALSHHPTPYVPSDASGNDGSITSSLRQWRKKDYGDKQHNSTDVPTSSSSSIENSSHVAMVAPHTYYPRPDVCHFQHQYSDYGTSPYKPAASTTSTVKYSEIVENQSTQSFEQHISSSPLSMMPAKHKEKDFSDLYGGTLPSPLQSQSHHHMPPMKHPYNNMDNMKQQQQQRYSHHHPPSMVQQQQQHHSHHHHQTQVHPFMMQKQQPQMHHQYQQFFPPKYNTPPGQYSHPPPPPPSQSYAAATAMAENNFLARLNTLDSRLAQSIMNDAHLRDSPGILDHQGSRPFSQTQRVYSTAPPHRNISQTYGGGGGGGGYGSHSSYDTNYNGKSNHGQQFQHNGPKYFPLSSVEQHQSPPVLPNISPTSQRGGYIGGGGLNYSSMMPPPPPKMSPNYPNCNNSSQMMEYAQHYQHRRPLQIPPQEYYSPTSFLQNRTISPHESHGVGGVGGDDESSRPRKSSLKQYLESWVDEEQINMPEIVVSNGVAEVENMEGLTGSPLGGQEEPLYVLDTTEVSNENLPQFLHLQQVEKLPDNIRGYYHSTSSTAASVSRRVIVENNSSNGTSCQAIKVKQNENPRTAESVKSSGQNLENKVVQIHIVEAPSTEEKNPENEAVIIQSSNVHENCVIQKRRISQSEMVKNMPMIDEEILAGCGDRGTVLNLTHHQVDEKLDDNANDDGSFFTDTKSIRIHENMLIKPPTTTAATTTTTTAGSGAGTCCLVGPNNITSNAKESYQSDEPNMYESNNEPKLNNRCDLLFDDKTPKTETVIIATTEATKNLSSQGEDSNLDEHIEEILESIVEPSPPLPLPPVPSEVSSVVNQNKCEDPDVKQQDSTPAKVEQEKEETRTSPEISYENCDEENVVYQINDTSVMLQIADELLEINVTSQNGKKIISVKTFSSDAILINNEDNQIEIDAKNLNNNYIDAVHGDDDDDDNNNNNNNSGNNGDVRKEEKTEDGEEDNKNGAKIKNEDIVISPVEEEIVSNEECFYNEEIVSSSTERTPPPVVEQQRAPDEIKTVEEPKCPVLEIDSPRPKTKAALKFLESSSSSSSSSSPEKKTNTKTIKESSNVPSLEIDTKKQKEPSVKLEHLSSKQKSYETIAPRTHQSGKGIKSKCKETKTKDPTSSKRTRPKIITSKSNKHKKTTSTSRVPPPITTAQQNSKENKPKKHVKFWDETKPKHSAPKEDKIEETVTALIEEQMNVEMQTNPPKQITIVQVNRITSSTTTQDVVVATKDKVETKGALAAPASAGGGVLTDDWEDKPNPENMNKRRLSLQEYNERKRRNSSSSSTSRSASKMGESPPNSPVLNVNFSNHRTYSRASSKNSVVALPPPPPPPLPPPSHPGDDVDLKRGPTTGILLSDLIELKLPTKIHRHLWTPSASSKPLSPHRHTREDILENLDILNDHADTLLRTNQELMRRFLKRKHLSVDELQKVKKIIGYKRLLRQFGPFKSNKEVGVELEKRCDEGTVTGLLPDAKRARLMSPLRSCAVDDDQKGFVSVDPLLSSRSRVDGSLGETKLESSRKKVSVSFFHRPKSKPLRTSSALTATEVDNYSVSQVASKSKKNLTLLFKRNDSTCSNNNDWKMQPVVRLKRDPHIERMKMKMLLWG